MKYNKLFLVSLAILVIFMLGAVSATDDVSVDNITVEESSFDSVEEMNDVELNENEDDLLESANQDIVSDKKSMSMNVCIWDGEFEDTVDWELTPNTNFEDIYVKVSLSPKVNGTLSLYMDGKHIENKKITKKTHYFNLNVKEVGKHTAEVRYSGNDEYESNSASAQFEIVSYRIFVHDVWYGDNSLLVNIDDAVGDIVAVINGKRYTAPLIRGFSSIELDDLNMGNYSVHIDYSGDKNHAPRSMDTNMEVCPQQIYTPSSYDMGWNDDREVSLQLPPNAKGNLVVKVDGSEIANVALVNGYASVSLAKYGNFDVEYDVEAYYTGTDYDVDSVSDCFKIVPQIDVETELINNHQYTLTFTLPNTYSGDLEVTAPGYDTINSKVVNGKSSVKFYAKGEGNCDISVYYVDVSGYEYYTTIFGFVGPDPNMVATVDSKVGQNPVFKVNVANDAGGAISVLINGKEYTSSYFTKSGSLVIPGLADGKYTAIVTYSGDYKYPSVSKTITFTKTSKKASKTKISLKLTKVTVKKSAKKLVLKATLKINGKVAKNKKITFKFNKKTYKAKTNKKGVAKVTIKKSVLKKLKVGKKIKYQASYGKTTVKKTVKVKK